MKSNRKFFFITVWRHEEDLSTILFISTPPLKRVFSVCGNRTESDRRTTRRGVQERYLRYCPPRSTRKVFRLTKINPVPCYQKSCNPLNLKVKIWQSMRQDRRTTEQSLQTEFFTCETDEPDECLDDQQVIPACREVDICRSESRSPIIYVFDPMFDFRR
jgi:hypothetical protein